MSILALEMLTHVETTADIRLVRDGDRVRILARPGTDVSSVTEQVRELKSVLHEALLQREIMALAHGPSSTFDRARFDALYTEWEQRYRLPREAKGELPCPE